MKRTRLSLPNKIGRVAWNLVWLLFYRPSPTLLHAWRRFLLRLFGASIGKKAHPYPSARIWAPWNLVMGDRSCLANHVDCYCVDTVTLGDDATVSQYSFLCTASHDHNDPSHPLVSGPIRIGSRAWVAADAFIGPGVTVADGAVIGARAAVFRDIPPWMVAVGVPAKVISERVRHQ